MIIKKIHDKIKVTRNYPINMKEGDGVLFEKEIVKDLQSITIVKKKNLYIIQGSYIVSSWLSPEINFSHTPNIFDPLKERLSLGFKLFKNEVNTLNGNYCWVVDAWSNNYFHWITDTLQRIYLLEENNQLNTILIPDFLIHIPFIASTLKYINSKIKVFDSKPIIKVDSLVTVTYPAPTGNFNPLTLCDYRDWLLSKIKSDSISRIDNIYVSRKKASFRKVINEKEIETLVQIFDFKVIYLEDFTWEEQVILFRDVEKIISIHGAGLTNCLFSKYVKVLELRKTNDQTNNCYFSLCNILNHEYHYLLDEPGYQVQADYDDLYIDLIKLEKILVKYFSK